MLCEHEEIMLGKTGVETSHLRKRQEKKFTKSNNKTKNHGLPGNKFNEFCVIVVKTPATCF